MARTKGSVTFPFNFEIGAQSPMDARLVVASKADLIAASTYSAKNYYKGMQVVVADTQEVYILKDVSKITSSDYSGWTRIDGSGSKVTVIDSLTSSSTTAALSARAGKQLQDEKLSKTEAGTTYIPKSSIADNLETSDSNKVLSAKQGLALSVLIEEAKNTVGVYKLLKVVEEGTLTTTEEVNKVLGTYSTFNTEVNKPSVIIGKVRDSNQVMHITALSVRASTANNTIYMYSPLPSNREVHIKATYSGSNWTSCVTEFINSVTGVIIE